MIIPTKRIEEDRALLTLGAEILMILIEPKTVSRIWEELKRNRENNSIPSLVTFDWFVLALDMLFILGAIEIDGGQIRRISR